jgi:hypothetical protein
MDPPRRLVHQQYHFVNDAGAPPSPTALVRINHQTTLVLGCPPRESVNLLDLDAQPGHALRVLGTLEQDGASGRGPSGLAGSVQGTRTLGACGVRALTTLHE